MLKGRAVIQIYPDRNELTENITKFNKDKCKFFCLGRRNSLLLSQDRQGTVWPGSSFAEKALGALVGSKLNESQRCTLAVKNAKSILGYFNRTASRRTREGNIPLLSTH